MQRQNDKIEWAVGIFEGEGNIYRNDKTRQFIMSVKMKDEDIVKRFYHCVGFGRVKKRKPYRGYAPMWEWQLTRTNDILDLSEIILPLMGKRRKKLILQAIKNKKRVKEKQKLKKVPECNYMKEGELSSRGAKKHIRNGEKPCNRCKKNQREYNRKWRNFLGQTNDQPQNI